VAIDLDAPDPEHWTEIIPQGEHTIQGVTRVGNRWVARLLTHAHTQVRLYDLNGDDLGPVALPGVGTARGFDGDPDSSETFFSFERFVQPETSYRLDVDTGEVRAVQTPELAFDGSRYETTQVFYSSRDGTRIPMFITHKKGLDLNGSHPTLLYGYGGFDISILPAFRVYNAVWLEMGGVYASANLRGGGEYGVDWHQAGTGVRKQNVFDDFIAAAEWLVANGYTTREKLAIYGRSNGGLLVGAALTQRPDLFGAALPAVGVHDMLRYHEFTIGWAWASDFGRSDDPEVFDALYAYSPLHNAEAASYPPVLVTTADHDDRVVPLHSYKFAAALQHAQQGPAPVLIRIDTGAGHGAGKSVGMKIDEWTDMLSFLAHALEMDLSW